MMMQRLQYSVKNLTKIIKKSREDTNAVETVSRSYTTIVEISLGRKRSRSYSEIQEHANFSGNSIHIRVIT